MYKKLVVLLLAMVTLTGCIEVEAEEEVVEKEPTEEIIVQHITEVVKPQYTIVINEEEAIALAQMAWGEARGCSDMEIAATMWCVLNRVDKSGDSVIEVITAPYQFHGYSPNHPVTERIYNLAVDVLTRWQKEQQGASPEEVGRVLPQKYLWFYGDGERNHFKDQYEYDKATIWDWSYPNPYEGTEGS